MIKLTINNADISYLVGKLKLSSNIDSLGDQLDFEMPYASYLKYQVSEGDTVRLLSDDREVFLGIVVVKKNNQNSREFICFDFAFYLNKSKTIKQFRGIAADAAIKQLLQEFNIPEGEISPIPVVIKKIYYDKEVSEVLKDILQEANKTTGIKYLMEMDGDKLCIYEDTEKVITAYVKLAENLAPINCMTTISGPVKTLSIEDMRNSVKLYIGNEDKVQIYAEAQNNDLISKYGLLQETQSLEEKNIAQAKNIAQNLLEELGRVSETVEFTVLGSFDLKAGRIIEVNEPTTEIKGKYRIRSAEHEIGANHTTKLELEAI